MNKHGGYFGTNKDLIDFSVNLNPLGCPDSVHSFVVNQPNLIEAYPEPYNIQGRVTLGRFLQLGEEQVILGNGAIELIYLFARAFKPKKVLIIQPTFNEYERAFRQYNANCVNHQLDPQFGFQLQVEDLVEDIIKEKPEVVVLCNPNNPTGGFVEIETIERVLKALMVYSGYLLLDESFCDFENKTTGIGLLSYSNLFIIRSMTKYYAIAGIRLGYGLGHRTVIEELNKYKEPWTLNGFASSILECLLSDEGYRKNTNAWYHEEKAFMEEQLRDIILLTPLPSFANFFLCQTSISADLLQQRLLEKGIYVRTCEDFRGLKKDYIRFALRKRSENEQLINALKEIL